MGVHKAGPSVARSTRDPRLSFPFDQMRMAVPFIITPSPGSLNVRGQARRLIATHERPFKLIYLQCNMPARGSSVFRSGATTWRRRDTPLHGYSHHGFIQLDPVNHPVITLQSSLPM